MGNAPTPNVATVYTRVDGLTGSNQISPYPPLHILHAVTSSQQKRLECRKILYSRWRKTAFTRGSYSREAGGIVGAVRDMRVEGMARMGVDGVCDGALVDIVVDGGQDTNLDEPWHNALCRASQEVTWVCPRLSPRHWPLKPQPPPTIRPGVGLGRH